MKCPHCGTTVYVDMDSSSFYDEQDFDDKVAANIHVGFCPSCRKPIVEMEYGEFWGEDELGTIHTDESIKSRIYPIWEKATILDDSIPEKYRKLFAESEQVNCVSPKASATLSRYLLQMLLHEELHIKEKNLQLEIEALEKCNNIPSELITILQVMRRVANFGAHPKKSTNSNEIVEVEKGEAEVMLEVLKQLFDFLFVKPKRQEQFLKDIEAKYGIKP